MGIQSSVFAALAAAFVLVPVVGCSSTTEGANAMRIEKTCTKTACDQIHERDRHDCSRCLDACLDASYSCDPSTACRLNCGSSSSGSCTDAERSQCVQTGFVATGLATEPGAEVLGACERMFDKLDGCKLRLRHDRSTCATWARVERRESAQTYDCVATAPCDGDVSACVLPATTFGDEVCDALGAKCSEAMVATVCSSTVRALLNEAGGGFKDDVIAAERACLASPTCEDAAKCHVAWANAVVLY